LKHVKQKLLTVLLVVAALVVATFSAVTTTARPSLAATGAGTRWPIDGYGPNEQSDNVILKWNERLLETIRTGVPPRTTGPVVTARAIGVLHTATYDAWAAYDESAVGTRLLGDLRQPESQRTGQLGLDNKKKAISYAAYRVLVDLFPSRASVFSGYMERPVAEGGLGYSPISASTDTTTPEGVGNVAAEAVLQFRRGDPNNPTDGDGSNQQRDSTGAVVYPSNVTYTPVNTWQTVTDRWQWQPMCVPLVPYGTPCTSPSTVQSALAPHWKNVASFALNSTTHYPPQFVLPGPPKLSNGQCCDPKDVDTALSQTSDLTDTEKAKSEYWSDGPGSEFPPGHLAVLAQALSRIRKGTLDQTAWLDRDVKVFFGLGNALMDAGISAWQSKYEYNFARPITAIRERYKGQMITSWLGPGQGYGKVLGQNWQPYQQTNVVTPGFPEYVSGHSTFSGAGGVVLALAFGNNGAFNAKVTIPAGSSKIETGTPAKPVVLSWKTLDTASDEAGWSRRWGGIHFQTGDEHGRGLGKTIGYNVWKKAQLYFTGDPTATTT
jgi:Vanadium chloroperoxidase N-terminal domain